MQEIGICEHNGSEAPGRFRPREVKDMVYKIKGYDFKKQMKEIKRYEQQEDLQKAEIKELDTAIAKLATSDLQSGIAGITQFIYEQRYESHTNKI